MGSRHIDFNRQSLYEMVWQTPIGRIAENLGIGRADVKRAAEALSIPMPPNGHWVKVEHGKGMPRPELPIFEGEMTYRHTWWVNEVTEEVERRLTQEEACGSPATASLEAHIGLPPLRGTIAECLPIIKKMATRLKKSYKDSRRWPTVAGFQGLFELSVSPANQERALLALDRVLRHCQSSGLKVISDESGRDPAHFVVEGAALTMRIFEAGRREEREPTPEERARLKADPNAYLYRSDRYTYYPTNILKLEVQTKQYRHVQFTVADGSKVPLAERIGDVPRLIKEWAHKEKLKRDVQAEVARANEERRQAHLHKVEKKREELGRLKHFEEVASQLERAVRLRGLADEMERCGRFAHVEGLEKVTWIRNAADWLDPLLDKTWPGVDDVPDHF